VLCINAVSYVVSATCFLFIRFPAFESAPTAATSLANTLQDVMDGFRYVLFDQRMVMLLIGAASTYTFASSAFSTLFPVFGKKMLDLGPIEVGYLWSAFGAGLMVMSLGLISLSGWPLHRRIQVMSVSSLVSGCAIVGLVLSSNRLVAAFLMCVIGMGAGTLTPIAWGVLQEIAPASLLGRVLAIYNLGAMTSAIVGMTLFGWMTQEVGERSSVVGIGIGFLLTAAVASYVVRWVRANWTGRSPVEESEPMALATQPSTH
jgi:MFS family permease